jgi:hypothetical protein
MSSEPPPIPESLNTYFAVQLKDREVSHHVAGAVLHTAKSLGLLFRRLEVLDTVTVGTSSFVRMRADLVNPFPVLDKVYADGRGVISSMAGGDYAVRLFGGRIGKVPNLFMHSAPKVGQARMYRGTKIKRWETQFGA